MPEFVFQDSTYSVASGQIHLKFLILAYTLVGGLHPVFFNLKMV
jgi:hypothetical protein